MSISICSIRRWALLVVLGLVVFEPLLQLNLSRADGAEITRGDDFLQSKELVRSPDLPIDQDFSTKKDIHPLTGQSLAAPVNMSVFDLSAPLSSMSSQPASTVVAISGVLRVRPDKAGARSNIFSPPEYYVYTQNTQPASFGEGREYLPEMTIAFDIRAIKSSDSELIHQQFVPRVRHLQLTQHPTWDYIVGIGHAVRLSAESTVLRVSLPFALVEKNQNCVHNGVMLLDIAEDGSSQPFYYQISSETCLYFQADMWGSGTVSAELQSLAVTPAAQVNAIDKRQVSSSLTALNKLASGMDLARLQLQHIIEPLDMSALGVVYQGQHFAAECETRAGPYPFCEQMLLPSYSLAKSIFGGLLVMFLEQQYGGLLEQPVSDWVAQCATAEVVQRWQDVTVKHLLNMTTGNYHSTVHGVDEGADHNSGFFSVASHAEKLQYACSQFNRQSAPGTQFVYHTSDTYLLGSVLQAWWQHKTADPAADVFNDVLVKQIFAAVELSPVASESRRTQDASGQPFAGYGLFLLRSDIARLAHFIARQWQEAATLSVSADTLVSDNRHAPLSPALLQQTLNQNSADSQPTEFANIRYRNSFWLYNLQPILQCEQAHYVPYMMGYGGLALVFLTPDLQFYYVSDSNQYNWRDATQELNKLEGLCP